MSFVAKYGGPCGGCEERIKPGEAVEYVDDELVHVGCDAATTPERAPRPVCPGCWTEMALNGRCACA